MLTTSLSKRVKSKLSIIGMLTLIVIMDNRSDSNLVHAPDSKVKEKILYQGLDTPSTSRDRRMLTQLSISIYVLAIEKSHIDFTSTMYF